MTELQETHKKIKELDYEGLWDIYLFYCQEAIIQPTFSSNSFTDFIGWLWMKKEEIKIP